MLYFDHNATYPLVPAASDAWLDAAARFRANPSSPHRLGRRAEVALDAAREELAQRLGCDAAEIVWTSGATESNNTAVAHFAAAGEGEGEAWVSAIEHACTLAAVRRWFPARHRLLPATSAGVVDLGWLKESLHHHRPAFVAVLAANNETGVLQPWREVAALCSERGVPFLCDAAQWLGKLPAAGLGVCDLLTGCGHKFGGAPGVGFLKCATPLRPLLVGGPQEEGRRAGTENVPGVLAMMAALRVAEGRIAQGEETHGKRALQQRVIAELKARIPGVEILGESEPRLWNTVAAIMPEAVDCRQRWVVKIDALGFAVSTGSACASGREKPSHVLSAMGVPADVAGRALRFSSGWETTSDEWDRLIAGVAAAWAELRG